MTRRTYNIAFMPCKLREWRDHRGLTLEQMVQALTVLGVDTTQASLSRIERGLQAWNQPILQACAEVLNAEVWQLLKEGPTSPKESLSDVCNHLDESQASQVESIVLALFPKKVA